ncbi:MAG: carbohydrate-binding protein, partial [Dokdonella sp.]|nr:carbohydrate-binding protein [Dokdonella sp.]
MIACLLPAASPAQDLPACAPAWAASTVYVGGDRASQDHVNYLANWWTQGEEPATHSGPPGSAQPWTAQGACSGDGGGDPPDPVDPIFAN